MCYDPSVPRGLSGPKWVFISKFENYVVKYLYFETIYQNAPVLKLDFGK